MKTIQEIADEYGIHRCTLVRRLKAAHIHIPRGLVCPKDQDLIYDTLGRPTKPLRKAYY